MRFYQSIAAYYDDAFPISNTLRRFVDSLGIDERKDTVLDIGCATGELAIYLSSHAKKVVAVDLDKDLIQIAKAKQSAQNVQSLEFVVGDMNEIDRLFSQERFQYIFCIGNTLVHLLSLEDIEEFLRKVSGILIERGSFIFQILNYEKVLSTGTKELPLIENEKIVFERTYGCHNKKDLLAFNTRLFIKATGQVIENSIDLYPLAIGQVEDLLSRSVFRVVRYLGGFDGHAFTAKSDLLIGIIEKKV